MKKFDLQGTGVALVTPFHKQGNIDFTSLGRLIDHTIEGGVDYLVSLGTTSEYPTLSSQEQLAVVEFTIEKVENRVPVVLGMGGNDTRSLVDKIRHTDLSSIAAILSVAPYYNKPNQKGLYAHYKAIAEASNTPIILYNVPGRCGVNMTAETTLQLANDFSNIIGIKEASGNMAQCMEILANKPQGFTVVSGEDALVLPMIALGAQGVISVAANAYPNIMSELVTHSLKSNMKKARAVHEKLLPFSNAIFDEGNPTGIKAALEIMGICQNNLRLPLVKSSKQLYSKLQTIINNIDK
ncbi:MAG: 4-hydroxy-tetrahydrodipicolinate synthase [Bacteroidales bacterium]|jgi:4-hydroxy-tetrahydrodipicolinate synthase|nr:4-hydroxy-tetrahydrodipicolinate synthase [Bacteroidales bacterium]MEE0900722.1 4-hydroxy-tetrahydrodipicolinate synthase [Bacteroidales bacterium]MEE0926377.1 4-hydroxy-tetrahydrodipicolinate synthase [Bacteroidales bacterium]MEE0936930.1 4-hydroxy-tetrahydrodipicolinate synthase [Bacteroidales bacterium]MEE0947529.1 4-hydroxy-tetrahydrodipicolinate synthase [Bacteroidales bacterium]